MEAALLFPHFLMSAPPRCATVGVNSSRNQLRGEEGTRGMEVKGTKASTCSMSDMLPQNVAQREEGQEEGEGDRRRGARQQ